MTKLSIDTFNNLKKKYGGHSSWTVWGDVIDRPTSNMEDLSIFENKNILEVLNPEIVLVALNFSVDKKMEPWENFHGRKGEKKGEVYKLRYALKNTPLWGAYITDIIVGYVDPNADTTMQYLRENPDIVLKNVKRFEKEIKDLNSDNPILYALGDDVFEILNNNLSHKYKIKKISHYGWKVNQEKYKEKVWDQLDIK